MTTPHLRMKPLQWLSRRLRRARCTVGAELGGVEATLFLMGSHDLTDSELAQHLSRVDELLDEGELFEPGVVPGLLVWDAKASEIDDLSRSLRALSERLRGVELLVQTWTSGRLSRGGYDVTAHACVLTGRGDELLWRRQHSLRVVDSRSTAGRSFHPWRAVRWVS